MPKIGNNSNRCLTICWQPKQENEPNQGKKVPHFTRSQKRELVFKTDSTIKFAICKKFKITIYLELGTLDRILTTE